MSTKLSQLVPGQFAVIQTDPRTGVPFTRDERWAIADPADAARGAPIHTEVFLSLEAAEAACLARVRERPDTEWWIFDHQSKAVKIILDSDYWKSREPPDPSWWRRLLRRLRASR